QTARGHKLLNNHSFRLDNKAHNNSHPPRIQQSADTWRRYHTGRLAENNVHTVHYNNPDRLRYPCKFPVQWSWAHKIECPDTYESVTMDCRVASILLRRSWYS